MKYYNYKYNKVRVIITSRNLKYNILATKNTKNREIIYKSMNCTISRQDNDLYSSIFLVYS